MKRSLIPLLAFSLIALVACNKAANNASSSPYASGSAAASARATGSVAASAQASASASGTTKYITLDVPVPQSGMNAGVDGKGWIVDIVAKGNGPAMDKVKPAFQTTSTTATGRNTNFPGLVVIVKESSGSSGSSPNLAKLFQMIGLPNTLQGAGISSVGTSASASPSASAYASASAAPSAAGSAATSSKAVDQETAAATWFVQQSMFGSDADVELDVFVVDGDAPDSISSDTSDLKIVSNIVTVHFHINGGGKGSGPSGSASPSTSAAPSGSSAPGSASPSPSASSTP